MGMARVVRRAPPPKMLELVANPGYLHVSALQLTGGSVGKHLGNALGQRSRKGIRANRSEV